MASSPLFDRSPLEQDFRQRIDVARKILDATDYSPGGVAEGAMIDISRESRGLCIVLLYAAYENLLKGTSRAILEAAIRCKVGNRRLRPEFQVFAVYSKLHSITDKSSNSVWKGDGRKVIDLLQDSSSCSINADTFPNDGSHMKSAQVATLCQSYGLGHPAPILGEAWGRIDTIVSERNGIAHGKRTPEEIGRNYSIGDLRNLVSIWEARWCDFLIYVERQASTRDFYRKPR
ncbi:MAE_28990/MAE_18760 family HEPN-like nuclease [Nocardia sp. NPDC004085]|uniref:MAE_28990/MAE_18760 family HEPN-like nuclease n=1 Tax=Nocardia sp. NPDC019255 TaxID=3154591 RepID=UPI00340E9B71